jgi:hypothetical protein
VGLGLIARLTSPQEDKMKVSVEVETLKELEYLFDLFEPTDPLEASGHIEDVDWITWIENKRREHQLSWAEFSRRSGTCVETVWRYRKSHSQPAPRVIARLVRAFGA